MNWTVKIITKDDYMKDVIVHDYPYSSDAIRAAMAQTNAKSFISCNPHLTTDDYSNKSSSSQENNFVVSGEEISTMNGFEGVLLIACALTIFFAPALSAILLCIAFVSILLRKFKEDY